MNGARSLLDSNVILGLIKGHEPAVSMVRQHGSETLQFAYSSISRMEVLGFPAITTEEETAIAAMLGRLQHLPVTMAIEDAAISLRRAHKIRLPDAIILATAQIHRLTLLTLDRELLSLSKAQP